MPSILGYTGEYQDPVTGGYPLGNGYRMYLPELMRFSAPDDLSPFDEGGIHPYVYCGDDPINHSDPSGHISIQALEEFVATLINNATREATQEVSAMAVWDATAAVSRVTESTNEAARMTANVNRPGASAPSRMMRSEAEDVNQRRLRRGEGPTAERRSPPTFDQQRRGAQRENLQLDPEVEALIQEQEHLSRIEREEFISRQLLGSQMVNQFLSTPLQRFPPSYNEAYPHSDLPGYSPYLLITSPPPVPRYQSRLRFRLGLVGRTLFRAFEQGLGGGQSNPFI